MSYPVLNQYMKKGKEAFLAGDYLQAENAFKAALDEAKKYQTPNEYLAHQLKVLGVFYFAMGEAKDAETYLLRSLEMERQLFNSDLLQVGKSLNQVGLFYHFTNQLPKAERAYKEALDLLEKAHFRKVPEVGSTLYYVCRHLLAMVYCGLNKLDAARSLCQDSGGDAARTLGPGGREMTMDLHAVALKYCNQEHFLEAKKTCNWILHVFTEKLETEYLGAVVQGDKISARKLQILEEMLKPSYELLARYDDAWRPSILSRDEVLPRHRIQREETKSPDSPSATDRIPRLAEDHWRP
ncbi:MAG: tetratricopeptide repeat protein [bacterium]|jgi:tetratricopeptide (TPR) repeat protein|nr:tetratricopeptide repeat protein [bacterium]